MSLKTLRVALATLTLLISSAAFSAAPVAAGQQGLCSASSWDPGATGQHYFKDIRDGINAIDEVHGWVTVRKLWPCEGLSNRGWSFAAAANIQCDTCGYNWIFQVGYLTEAGNAGDVPYFVYTDDDGSGTYHLISNPRPSLGSRYHFKVYNSGGSVRYEIRDGSNNLLWSRNTGTTWTSNLDTAWWGWEVSNMWSAPGICYSSSCNDADLVGQLSLTNSGTVFDLTYINPTCYEPDLDCADAVHRHVSGGSNQILNVETHSGFQQPTG